LDVLQDVIREHTGNDDLGCFSEFDNNCPESCELLAPCRSIKESMIR